ncbi:NAD-dependent protein deacetylase sirtuin-2, partial [Coemansia brasiliensis]
MAGDANLDELAKQLDQSLSLGNQHTSTTVTAAAAAVGLEDVSDSSVPEKRSDVESLYSVPSAVGSLTSIDEDITNRTATVLQVPLTAYMPELPKKAASLFAAAASPVHHIAHMIKSGAVKRIIVMAGAGISTDAGIPDFRSPGTGLYANLQQYRLPYPEAIFTIDYFRRKPKPFFVLAKELYPGQFIPTISHFFVKLLAQKNLLLRHYTQNIDCLERVAGVDSSLIVEAHGSFHSAHCISTKCRKEHAQDWVKEQIFGDKIPHCIQCKSLVKPDITFFGE